MVDSGIENIYHNYCVREVSWKSVIKELTLINPSLAETLLANNLPEHLSFLEAEYTYGEFITKDGEMYLPLKKGDSIAISKTEPEIQRKLDYSFIPVFLVCEKMAEVYIETNDRTIPLNSIKTGEYGGLFEYFDYIADLQKKPRWTLTAGARNIFLLPKISDQRSINRLNKNFEIETTVDFKNNFEHWHIFKSIAHHAPVNQRWKMKIFIFTKQWFDKTQDHPYQKAIHYLLLQKTWRKIQHHLGFVETSITWQNFIEIITQRKQFPEPYITDTIKHIISILFGKTVGFQIAEQTDEIAPIALIQNAFIEVYQLKEYFPLIATATQRYGSHKENDVTYQDVYYSLNHPTLLEGSPLSKQETRIINNLKEIKLLLDITREKMQDPVLNLFEFYYFHSDVMTHGAGILSPENLPALDPNIHNQLKGHNNKKFCTNSIFWNGCIYMRAKHVKNN